MKILKISNIQILREKTHSKKIKNREQNDISLIYKRVQRWRESKEKSETPKKNPSNSKHKILSIHIFSVV